MAHSNHVNQATKAFQANPKVVVPTSSTVKPYQARQTITATINQLRKNGK